ncbi:MAG TPA: 3-dehydroquinate synthase [Bacteroidales bacterium]|nr:3-dehydroquinate synthase [Bacteroidales bacterium]
MKKSCRLVTIDRPVVFCGNGALNHLDRFLASNRINREQIFILTDRETHRHCLPVLSSASRTLDQAKHLTVAGGEESKTLETATGLWEQMLAAGAGRNSLLINLGGGVISDLGGFVAACFHRGIRYVNITTSLIGQADASIGGKTGINLGRIKNQIGAFCNPAAIFIDPVFLSTLPKNHLRSGWAEALKCALTGDESLWNRLAKHPVEALVGLPVNDRLIEHVISKTVDYKLMLVKKDFRERNLRKTLNFGHTLGHAFETLSMERQGESLLHGEAVAAGMICAVILSRLKTGLDPAEGDKIIRYLQAGYGKFSIGTTDVERLLRIVAHDKKRRNGAIEFTLLTRPGKARIQLPCREEEIVQAVRFYQDL